MVVTQPVKPSQRRSAFTLLEVLIVVAIIVVLVSLGTVYMIRYLDQANKDAATIKARHLAQVLQIYQAQKGEYPPSLDALLQPGDGGKPFVAPDQLKDPWGRAFQFEASGQHNGGYQPDVWTTAPDGQIVGNWANK